MRRRSGQRRSRLRCSRPTPSGSCASRTLSRCLHLMTHNNCAAEAGQGTGGRSICSLAGVAAVLCCRSSSIPQDIGSLYPPVVHDCQPD